MSVDDAAPDDEEQELGREQFQRDKCQCGNDPEDRPHRKSSAEGRSRAWAVAWPQAGVKPDGEEAHEKIRGDKLRPAGGMFPERGKGHRPTFLQNHAMQRQLAGVDDHAGQQSPDDHPCPLYPWHRAGRSTESRLMERLLVVKPTANSWRRTADQWTCAQTLGAWQTNSTLLPSGSRT